MKRIKITLALAATLLAANPMLTLAAPPHTGIQGQSFLYISWGTPIEIEPGVWIGVGDVQLPVATTFTVLSAQNHREVARVTTDANGLYSVSLPPGNYVVVSDPIGLSPFLDCTASLSPVEVTVHAKQFTLANIFYFREGFCSIAGTPIQIGDGQWSWLIPFADTQAQTNDAVSGLVLVSSRNSQPPKPDDRSNEGHHQSGIVGRVGGGTITATPTEGIRVTPDIVRVYSDTGKLVAEVETEVDGNDLWHFQINLKPGTYTVTATVPGSFLNSIAFGVIVEKKQLTGVDLSFYTPL